MLTVKVLAAAVLACIAQAEIAPSPSSDASALVAKQADAKGGSPTGSAARASVSAPYDLTGQWLVDLARHQGHLSGRADPRSVSLHVIALLEGVKEVAPDCAEAYQWLFDLLYRMGRMESAREALRKYVELAPGDDAAQIRYLGLSLDEFQTAEERTEYVKGEINKPDLPRAYESELHRWLANRYYERRETEQAAREVEHALRLNPMNVAARQLAYEMFGETEAALQRVEMALQLIAINPSQANLVWDLGEFLDRLSLHRQAQEWYNRAIEMHHRAEGQPVPAEFWHKLAVSYTRSGDYAEARDAATSALKIDENLHIARLLRATAAEKAGDAEAAAADVEFVAKAYEARVEAVVAEKRYDEAAEIGWFFCYHRPEKQRALRLAKVAMEDQDPSLLARLAYGCALRMNGQTDEAMKVLEPLASVDQLAALELAKAHIARGDKGRAITVLHKAATIQYSGIAYELIRDMLAKYDETAAQVPLNTKLIAVLDKFHRDVFDYHERPADFLKFSLRFVSERLRPAGPVRVTLRLENVGPFPITFGDGFMARPLVALNARLGGADGTSYKNYLQVMMNSRPVLLPGDAVEKTVTVDVGPMREELTRTVTRPMEVELSAMFDPVYEGDKIAAGFGTIKAGPIITVRPAIDVSPAGINALLSRAESSEMNDRIEAANMISSLLAEAEHAARDGAAGGLPLDTLRTTLAGLLSDHDWRVRAHAIVGSGWSKLDDRSTNAAAQAVRDRDNPVVRMLAVRLFAEQHGEKFRAVLEQLSKSAPHRCVRIMSMSYLPQAPRVHANRAEPIAPDDLP
ncbi:MAG: tetratricopeptide repeat protein [Planctomycetota bacterium]